MKYAVTVDREGEGIDEMRRKAGGISVKELLNRALTVYDWTRNWRGTQWAA